MRKNQKGNRVKKENIFYLLLSTFITIETNYLLLIWKTIF